MTDAPAVLIRNVLGFYKDDGGSHAIIGFQPAAGNPFAIALTPNLLAATFAAVVDALGQFPAPKMANRVVCAIEPSWIEFGEESPDNYTMTFRLDHGGSVSFYLSKESSERIVGLLSSALKPSAPPAGKSEVN